MFCILLRTKMSTKNVEKTVAKSGGSFCIYPVSPKFCQNCSILHSFRDKYFFTYFREIQDGRENGGENKFWQKWQMTLHIPYGTKILLKITLFRRVSKTNAFLVLRRKFKMATKNGGKTISTKNKRRVPVNGHCVS